MGKVYNRKTKEIYEDNLYKQGIAKFLYNNSFGRIVLKIVILPFFSKILGKYCDSKRSTSQIAKFIKDNNIDMDLYEKEEYSSFNDFFTRKKIIPNEILDNFNNKNYFISPADSKLLCYRLDDELKVNIKDSLYSLEELLMTQNEELQKFKNGNVLVFRLSVDDYHRYCHIDDGSLKVNYHIKGKLHTVSSISRNYKIYKENSRVVNFLNTNNFGDIIYVEVGALLVGKIVNNNKKIFKKGEEKGYFKYGGSTIVVITKDNIKIDEDILENSKNDVETKIEFGEKIGELL